ncbi:acetyl-CoA carboxylase carboxyltransferase subunit beta [bacterium]|nr:acetyl-CoA carboxylase carboxyltransferase subunit beta [bacterium]
MSIVDWFAKKEKPNAQSAKLNIPGDVWIKCPSCGAILFQKDLDTNHKVCGECQHHFRLSPTERVVAMTDMGSFVAHDESVGPIDFLGFKDTESYQVRIQKAQAKSPTKDAVLTGIASIQGVVVNMAVMDFGFMGGSMGSVVGEKITRTIERAIDNGHPVLIFSSSGGARMQEGIMGLMQMAKTSAALQRLATHRIPYVSVMCDPTTGGTSASFATLGDINLAEPGALISFAGPRVIEQTIRQKLPKGAQRSEFLLQHGMLDRVVHRKELPATIAKLLRVLTPPKGEAHEAVTL